jgi:hypothetical protein
MSWDKEREIKFLKKEIKKQLKFAKNFLREKRYDQAAHALSSAHVHDIVWKQIQRLVDEKL